MGKPVAGIICILLICTISLAETNAQRISISPTDTFSIPEFNSQIQFAENVSYTTANIENNTWYFTGLQAGGYAGYPIRGHIHFSAKNCNVTITYLQAWFQPEIGGVGLQWIKYSVQGAGTQTLDGNDLFPNSDKWTQWTVTINGQKLPVGESWILTDSEQLIISTSGPQSFVEVSVIHESPNSDMAPLPSPKPALVDFTTADTFSMPSSNGSLHFAVDGSYDKASLTGHTWSFSNLTLSNYAINAGTFAPNVRGRDVLPYIYQFDYPADLGVSAKDSSVTITGITPLTWHSSSPALNYSVQGTGSQTFTLPFKLSRFNWTVYIDGEPKQEGDGWSQVGDYQLKVTSAAVNVAIIGKFIETHIPPMYYWPVYNALIGIVVAVAAALIAFIVYRKYNAKALGTTTSPNLQFYL